MPLSQWTAFYGVVESRRFQALADAVSVTHAKNPKRQYDSFLAAARRSRGRTGGLDMLRMTPDELKRRLGGVGIPVVTIPKDAQEG